MRSLESGTHSSSFAGTAPQMVAPGPASPNEASKNPLSTPQSPGLLNARTGQGVQRRPQGKLALPGGLTRKKPGGLEVGRLQGQSQMRQQVHRRVPEMAVEPGSATPMDFHNNLVRMKVGGAGWRMQGKGRRRGAQGILFNIYLLFSVSLLLPSLKIIHLESCTQNCFKFFNN